MQPHDLVDIFLRAFAANLCHCDSSVERVRPRVAIPQFAANIHAWRISKIRAKLATGQEGSRYEPVQSRRRQDNSDCRERGAVARYLAFSGRHRRERPEGGGLALSDF